VQGPRRLFCATIGRNVNLPNLDRLSNLRGGPVMRRSDCSLFSSVLGRGCISTATHPPKRWPSSFVSALCFKPTPSLSACPSPAGVATTPYIYRAHNSPTRLLAYHPHPRQAMYDLPQSSTSRPHRAHSSKSHLTALMPLHTHTSSSRSSYQPNTRQADISRLLDPAYASSSTASTHSSGNVRACTQAYVDHTGEMHDPDYRDFPVLPPRHQQKNLHTPRRSLSTQSRISSTSVVNRPDRYKTYPLVVRPEWERGWATEVEDLGEEDEDLSSYEGGMRSPFASSSSSERTSSSRRASLPPSVYVYTPSTYYFGEPASTTSSPVDSLEEEQEEAAQSPFEDIEEEESQMPGSTSRTAASILRKMKRSSSGSTMPVVAPRPSYEDGDDKENHDTHFIDQDDDNVYVYFCSCSLLHSTLTSTLQ
jgi:hypothetical protein